MMSNSESTNSGANYVHFLQEMEEKQVRLCQAAWQLNPHRDCFLLLVAYHSNTGFYRVFDQTDEHFLKYCYNRVFNTEQRDTSNNCIVWEVLSTAQLHLNKYILLLLTTVLS